MPRSPAARSEILLTRLRGPAPVRSAPLTILFVALAVTAASAAIGHAVPSAHAQAASPSAIQDMVDAAEPGGTVAVAPGTYANQTVTIDKPLTLASVPPGAAVLTGNSSIAVRQGPGGTVAVSGLVFRGIECPAGGPNGTAVVTVAPPAAGPAGIVAIRNNTFDGTCSAAVAAVPPGAASSAASDVQVSGNTFRDIGAGAPNGSSAPPPPAIRLGAPAPAPSGAQVADSLVSSNHMFNLRGAAVQASGAQGVTILGNHIEGAGSSAIIVASNSSGVRIAGNTVIGAAAPAFAVWADSSGVLIMGNRVSESAGVLSVCAGRCDAGGGGIDVQQPDLLAGAAAPVRFHHNTVHESNTGALVENGGRQGTVDARANYYPGYDPAPSRLAGDPSATAMPNGSAPLRIGALLAATDLPDFDGVAGDAAVREAAARFNLLQVESGGNASIRLVGADLRLDDPLAAVSGMAEGNADAWYRPILQSQIDWMRAEADARGRDAAVGAVLALESPQEHYPFIVNRTGHVQANGANPDRVGVLSPIASADNPVQFAQFLEALDAAPNGSAMWFDYRIRNFVHEGQPVESKRSLLALHDLGTPDESDDLVLGAGYYPRPVKFAVGPSASSSIVDVLEYAGAEGLVLVSPSSLSPDLAARDSVYRMAPNDGVRAPRIAEIMAGDGARDVVALVQDDAYGNAAYERIRAEFDPVSEGSVLPKVPFAANITASEWGPAMARADALLRDASAQNPGSTEAVLYIGFDPPFAGAAAEAAKYPALAGARWYSTDLVGSRVVTDNAPALSLALSSGLKAVAFGVEPNGATRAVDAAIAARPGGGGPGDPRTGYAHAAHDAVLLIGGALAAGRDDPVAFAAGLRGLAGAGLPGGALGAIAFDANGDLVRPSTFSTWEISPDTRRWAITETSDPAVQMCSASLAEERLDLGSVRLGQEGEPIPQAVTNTGSAPITGIALNATGWSSGLPAAATSFKSGAGAFAPLAPGAAALGGGESLEPALSVAIDYKLDLTATPALPAGVAAGNMTQTVVYEITCG